MIDFVLQILIYIIIADVVLSYIPNVQHQNWAQMIKKVADVPQKPIRDLLPEDLPLDPAPIAVIMLCQLLMYLL